MAKSLADQVMEEIGQAAENYYRLLVVVAPAGAGKTAAFQEVHRRTGFPILNVNLDLSRQMLDLTERQRALQLPRLLGESVGRIEGDIVLLDNIEILFDLSLKQDSLRLLQNLSRNKTLVAAWSGSLKDGYMIYAAPEHPEYRRYELRDFLVATPDMDEG